MNKFLYHVIFLLTFISESSNAQVPFMQSCLINSCNGSCNEGNNEIIFLNTGASSVLVNSTNVNISYGTTSPPATNYTDAGLVTNAATTSALNTVAGCTPNLLIEATNTVVPPNSIILVVQNGICASSLNWSGICSMGPIYITYSNDAQWLAAGNFSNGIGLLRHFRSSITNTSGTTTVIDYNYTLPAGFGNDGAYATWTDVGGAAASYGDNDCILTPTMLPVLLIDFTVRNQADYNLLKWTTEREDNNAFFTIKKSIDGLNYSILTNVFAQQSTTINLYEAEDSKPNDGYTYYQLFQTDKNGKENYLDQIVAFRNKNSEDRFYPNPTTGITVVEFKLTKPELIQIRILNQLGKLVSETTQEVVPSNPKIELDFSDLPIGIYLIETIISEETNRFSLLRQ